MCGAAFSIAKTLGHFIEQLHGVPVQMRAFGGIGLGLVVGAEHYRSSFEKCLTLLWQTFIRAMSPILAKVII